MQSPAPLIPPSLNGGLSVSSYTSGLPTNGVFYMNPRISYPVSATKLSPVIVLVYGFGGTQDGSFATWVQILVSHGYTTIEFDPAIGPFGGGGVINDAIIPPFRALGAQECLELLRSENSRADSPVAGTLDLTRAAVIGHSWGGCASLLAAGSSGVVGGFKTVVALCPCNALPFDVKTLGVGVEAIRFPMIFGTYADVDVPALILAGAKDPIAIPSEAKMQYDTLPTTTPRALGLYADGEHVFPLLRELETSKLQQQVANMTLQWLGKYLIDDKKPLVTPSLYMSSWIYVKSPLTKAQKAAVIAVSVSVGSALLIGMTVWLLQKRRRLQSLQ